MLTIRDLTLTHRKDFSRLIDGLNMTVQPGERLALIGEEGNGKSTLLRAIAGDASIRAYVEIGGSIVNTFRTGYLPQELPARCREMSAYAYFGEEERFYDQTPRALGELAARLRLPADVFYSEQAMGAFSGGERVKLQLARLLLREPELPAVVGQQLAGRIGGELIHAFVRILSWFRRPFPRRAAPAGWPFPV